MTFRAIPLLLLLGGCGHFQSVVDRVELGAPEASAGVEVCLPLIGCHVLEVRVSGGDPPKACILLGPLRYCTRPPQ